MDRGRRLDLVRLGTGGLEVFSDLGFQVLAARAEDRLHAVADDHHPGGAERLEFVRVGLGDL